MSVWFCRLVACASWWCRRRSPGEVCSGPPLADAGLLGGNPTDESGCGSSVVSPLCLLSQVRPVRLPRLRCLATSFVCIHCVHVSFAYSVFVLSLLCTLRCVERLVHNQAFRLSWHWLQAEKYKKQQHVFMYINGI